MIYVAELMGGEHDGHVMEVDGWRDEILMPQRSGAAVGSFNESDGVDPTLPVHLHYRIAIASNGRPIRSFERYVYRLVGSAP